MKRALLPQRNIYMYFTKIYIISIASIFSEYFCIHSLFIVFKYFYYNFLIFMLDFSHISDRIKTTKKERETKSKGKEGTSHQKRNDLLKTILRKERYRPPKT